MSPEQLFSQATALHQQGRVADAAAMYEQLLQHFPDNPDILHLHGLACHQLGQFEPATASLQRAVACRPDALLFHLSLAGTLHACRDFAAAETACRAALALDPNHAEARNHLGVMLKAQGCLSDAELEFRSALALRPDYTEAWNNLGNTLRNLGRLPEAEDAFSQALALAPNAADTWNNLGNVLQQAYRLKEAEAAYRKALSLNERLGDAWFNLGVVLGETGQLEEAIAAHARALELDAANTPALDEMVHLMQRACLWDDLAPLTDELLRRFRSGEAPLNPYSLLELPASAADQLRCAEQQAAAMQARVAGMRAYAHAPRQRDKIRIGYLSCDYRQHPVAFLIGELFELHDRSRFETFAFAIGPNDHSLIRQRFEQSADQFIDLTAMGTAEAAARIHDSGIDILVDLTGYTTGARSEILALRPAPVQVNWLGYPGTMGARFVDYIIADAILIPSVLEHHYAETVVRMPHSYQINDRQRFLAAHAPARRDCGLPETGTVFCCFNHTHKILPGMFDAWMRILSRVPGSVLWLLESNPLAANNLRREAEARGIAPARIVFAPRAPLPEHLARYRVADLALDTFPYNSHTTASDALWTGCPIVTCVGETFASRVAASLLHAVDLAECVTGSFAEMENLAVLLAQDASRLSAMREHLTRKRSELPLWDTPRFVRDLEAAYAQMLAGGKLPH